ncbi:MAG: DegT/DnrJ/EryC1/StrS family aminotransferase [Bryobacteraceae bacterium]
MNSTLSSVRLAVLGGEPAFRAPLHVGRPNLGDRQTFLQLVEQILDRRWLSNDGPVLHAFESRAQEILGVKHAVATCNATVGLELALRATCPLGEVIMPAYTFAATAHAAKWCGYTPVFADVDGRSHQLTAALVEPLITNRTVAILAVHLWGACGEAEALEVLGATRGIPVLFDAAHAFSCATGGRRVGNFGHAEVFSFHATKFVNSGEGGLVTTNDDDLAQRLRLMRNFGFMGYDNVVALGTNAKMNEFCAAMGLSCLEAMDAIIAANRANWEAYRHCITALPGLKLYENPLADRSNHQYVVIEVVPSEAGLTRDELVSVLHEENVYARRYFYPGCHRIPIYRGLQVGSLPVTDRLADTVMVLPTGTTVGEAEIDRISAILQSAIENGPAVRAALRSRPPRPLPLPVLPRHLQCDDELV